MTNILEIVDDIKLNQIVCMYLNDSGFKARGSLSPCEANDLIVRGFGHKAVVL